MLRPHPVLLFALCVAATSVFGGAWPKRVDVYHGSTPLLDGRITPGEYDDASVITGVKDWSSQFTDVALHSDLSATVWFKHDGRNLYVAFDVTDDVIYGVDIPRWLPAENGDAHQLTRQGYPWFGDGVELLINALGSYSTLNGQINAGNGSSWQMVASSHKSRLGGLGVGGLLEGEPRSRDEAWLTYQSWIRDGAIQASVRVKDRESEGSGYVVEWRVQADPCLERQSGFWDPQADGVVQMGLNLVVGDLDEPEKGTGNFANFHHENWWAGERDQREWLKQWGTMVLHPGQRPAVIDTYPPGTIQLTPRLDEPLHSTTVAVPRHLRSLLPDTPSVLLPEGFRAQIFAAQGLAGPRFMAFSPDGILHVANTKAGGGGQFNPPNDGDVVPPENEMTGQIVALPDADGDGVADTTIIVVEGLWWANNLLFRDGELWVGDRHAVRRFADADGDGIFEIELPFFAELPPEQQHRTRTILVDEARQKLYVSVGSTCDICRESDSERATILEFDLDGSGRRVYARGLRNAVGLDLHPVTNELWATNNGHDREGRSLPPEWIDIVREDGFYGWPLAFGFQRWTDFTISHYLDALSPITDADRRDVESMRRPVALIPAHLAPMAIHFYTHDQFPKQYRNSAFVAMRGGSNAGVPGYKVMALFCEHDGSEARVIDFLTGLERQGRPWGKPVGLATDNEGNLYVSSDWVNHFVMRISRDDGSVHWEHDMPSVVTNGDTLIVEALIHVSRARGAASVTLDLSSIGGPSEILGNALDDSTIAVHTEVVISGSPGSQRILALVELPGGLSLSLEHLLHIPADGDIVVFSDSEPSEWRIDPRRLQHVDLASTDRASEGINSLALRPGFLSIEFVPSEPLHAQIEALQFAIHTGDAQLASVGSQMRLRINQRDCCDSVLEILRDATPDRRGNEGSYRIPGVEVVLGRDGWQQVSVPWSAFPDEPLKFLHFTAHFDGVIYLDDIRLIFGDVPTVVETATPHAPVDLRAYRTLDAHIHLYDPDRPEGIPWPPADSPLFRPALPPQFAEVARPAGVDRTIVIEASSRIEDNDWVLQQIAGDTTYAGLIGSLPVGEADFTTHLARLDSDPRFLGIRVDNLRARDLDGTAIADLEQLASGDNVLEILLNSMNIADAVTIAETVPDLRIIVDHLAGARVDGLTPSDSWVAAVQSLAEQPNVYCKLSGLFQQSGRTPAPTDVAFYEATLDVLWEAFGPDRLVYGSNWPVSSLRGGYGDHKALLVRYLSAKEDGVVDRVLWQNAVNIYRLPIESQTAVSGSFTKLPGHIELGYNYPNPFNTNTTIRLRLPHETDVKLEVFNLVGQRVVALHDGRLEAGAHSFRWNGRTDAGHFVSSGVYLYRLRWLGKEQVQRMLMLK
ncbi:MAG: amidohydrolase family protein [Candidatus Latescibacterota bacterium]|nr:amidohydrolase family protein [Candidatus Latescibacterota bacterium]